MEAGDSAADLGDALMFDFDFDNHEVGLIDQNHQSQTHPTEDHQQNTTSMNFSHENVEMGSSSDHLTVTATADTNSEDLDSSLENTTNLEPHEPSSVNPDQTMGTEQTYNPTTESSEFRLPAKENNQPQRRVNLENPNSANLLSGHPHFSQEGSNQQHLLASAPHNLSPPITSSFNNALLGAAAESYFPTREPTELGSSSGSNQSFLYNSNSNHQAQNLMGSTYNSIGFGYIDTSLGNGTNLQQNQSAFLQSPLSETPQQYPPTTAEMMPQSGGVSSFNTEHAINSNNSNQLSCDSEINFQNELLRLQGMDSFNLPTSLRADHQLAKNVENHDILNNQQPALPYQNSLHQTSIGLGINSLAQHNWFSNQNALYTPLTPSRPQVNQFLASNVFDPQSANAMSLGSSVPLRPEHSANNQQQLLNAVLVPAQNVLNPQSQYSMIAEQSMFPRLQNLQSQSNQVLPLAHNYNVQEPQGGMNLMLRAPSLPLSISTRPPEFPLYQQLNPSAGAPDLLNLQPANSIQLKNSLLSGFEFRTTQQSYNDHTPLTLGQMTNPQRDNSFLLSSSMRPRSQTFDLRALLHQTTKPSFTFPTTPASSQLSSVMNSATQRDLFGGHNPLGATPTASTFPQLELSLNRNEQSFLGRRSPSTSPFELAEASSPSSSSSKRPRMSNFPYKDFILLKDNASTASQSRENEGEKLSLLTNPSSNIARLGKNTLYDPLFEGLGLPIDPHLRLFNSNS